MTVWPFIPQRRVRERLEWKTEVIRCYSSEQRIRLRSVPRTLIDYEFIMLPQQIEAATELARAWGGLYLPFWTDMQEVGKQSQGTTAITVDTRTSRYTDYAFISENNNWELVKIDSVWSGQLNVQPLQNGYVNAAIMPACLVNLTAPFKFSKFSAEYFRAELQAVTTEDFNTSTLLDYPLYGGSFVITDRPIVGNSDTQIREFESFITNQGPIYNSEKHSYPISTSWLAWSFDDKDETYSFYRFMHHVKGRQVSFYAPRWTRDFILDQDITSTTMACKVNSPLDAYLGHICIVKKNGEQIYTEITEWNGSNATITDIEQTVSVSEVELICRMPLMRFDSDVVEFNYSDGGVVDVRLPMIEVPDGVL